MPLFRVIPSFRAPRTIAGFDYVAPKEFTVGVGALVRIPFRKQTIVGVIDAALTVSSVPKKFLKEIAEPYADLRLSTQTLALLHTLAARSFSSPASVLHAWLGTLPKKTQKTDSSLQSDRCGGAFSRAKAIAESREKDTPPIAYATPRLFLNHWHHPQGVVATATEACKDGKRVLILTPWTESARTLAEACGGTALTGDMADGARFAAWSSFLRGNIRCLVATRIGAWLATEADLVIVDEPENDDHKQDELAPRYDARWVAAQAQRHGTPVIAMGLTPRLTSSQQALKETPEALPAISSENIRWVDINRADWSPIAGLQGRTLIALEEALEKNHPCIIVHPIHGLRARMRCADCGWSPMCTRCGSSLTHERSALVCKRCHARESLVADCPKCGGTNFSKSRPGREAVEKTLRDHELSAQVLSLGEWRLTAARLAPSSRPLVILTDLSLLAGAAEDIRRRERLIIALRRLADVSTSCDGSLVIQGDATLLDDARTWLTSEGCAAALAREWEERNTFGLPPTTRLVKMIVRGTGNTTAHLLDALRPHLPTGATLSGPFAVERLPGTRTPRSIIHISFPAQTPDIAIQRLISPVLTAEMLVDLDPVSLFE
ncbi:MAG: primosomal protein [Candidatus Parcubacteria bacterium]|jgi:primosomal protein N'